MFTLNISKTLRNYSSNIPFDIVFIGSGPGGYVGAIKAAQLGLKTACIEKRPTLGGTCLNVGCIPSKSLLQNSHFFSLAQKDFSQRGIKFDSLKLDLNSMLKAKDKSINELTNGVSYLFKKNNVQLFKGEATIISPSKIQVTTGNDKKIIEANEIIIATGSDWTTLPNIKVNEKDIVSSTGALTLESVPEKMVVIGGGVIGLELGSVWSRLGSKVTVVEYLPMIGAGMDNDIALAFVKILERQGISFKLGFKVNNAIRKKEGKGFDVEIESLDNKKELLDADVVLVSIGRKPFYGSLGLEKLGIKFDKSGKVITDSKFQTNVPGIRAIGDVINGPMLAHKAEDEGIAVAEIVSKGHGHVNYNTIPSVIYTHPEVAWVGKTEDEVKQEKILYSVGTFPFGANSRAKTVNDSDGFVKVITESETDRLLGIHILGPNAGELIAEAVLAIEYGASSEDIARTCHAHPTLSEALKEACLSAHGLRKAINY